jgi:hypothetical protein
VVLTESDVRIRIDLLKARINFARQSLKYPRSKEQAIMFSGELLGLRRGVEQLEALASRFHEERG